ncbi:hypothetical protein PoB_002714100 [Plakobranchus ocellatus]|uniref:Uncharacterized protein n=1 Tax=Plakobranchus ocellatus TaxID=259542 RepID=A0AAV3ZXJ9_9GAST|nr:hypothetical protein PoB_002714100 [Plakobranchus ocellatus]
METGLAMTLLKFCPSPLRETSYMSDGLECFLLRHSLAVGGAVSGPIVEYSESSDIFLSLGFPHLYAWTLNFCESLSFAVRQCMASSPQHAICRDPSVAGSRPTTGGLA